MVGKSTIQIPSNVGDATVLKRFLLELVNYIDTARGLKDGDNVITLSYVSDVIKPYVDDSFIGYATESWVTNTALASYATESWVTSTALSGYATESWVTNLAYTSNPEQTAIADLNQTISATYTQSEVQAISDKVDDMLSALRGSNIISV